MIQHSYRLCRSALAVLLLVIAGSAALQAQEAFPATHVIKFRPNPALPTASGIAGIGFLNVDRGAQMVAFRLTFITPGDAVDTITIRKRTPDGSNPVLLTIPYLPGPATVTSELNLIDNGIYDVLDSGLLYLEAYGTITPEPLMSGNVQAVPSAATFTFRGSEVVPPVSGGDGDGFAYVVLDKETRSLHYVIAWSGLSGTPTSVGIYRAPTGQNGTLSHATSLTPGSPMVVGKWTNLTNEDITTLRAGGLYISVGTAAHADGEIRGQLIPIDVFTAALEPSHVVPPADNTFANGTGFMSLADFGSEGIFIEVSSVVGDLNSGSLNPDLDSAHVHLGQAGTTGPALTRVNVVQPNRIDQELDATTKYTSAQITAIRTGNSYIDVHTAEYANGELRGQWVPANTNLTVAGVPSRAPEGTAGTLNAIVDAGAGRVQFVGGSRQGPTNGRVLLSAMDGRRVAEALMEEGRAEITTASLPSGMYLAQWVRNGTALASCGVVIVR